MNVGLLLVPAALGGYWFLTHANPTRYWVVRQSGYGLFFASALAGSVLLAAARLLVVLLDGSLPEIQTWWQFYAPFDYSGTIALSALLAVAAPPLLNRFHGKDSAAKRAAKNHGDLVECLFHYSLDPARPRLIEISTKSAKSYIGLAQESGVRAANREPDVALIPLMSGYRNSETRELVITTRYAPALASADAPGQELSRKDFRVVVPVAEIVSARLFDTDAYKIFQASSGPGIRSAQAREGAREG